MKKLMAILGVVALVALPLVATAAARGEVQHRQLVVDFQRTFGVNAGLGAVKGASMYTEGSVFEVGQAGQLPPLGEYKSSRVKTEPSGVFGSFGQIVFRIFNQGDIHTTTVGEVKDGQIVASGAIVGGTGRFRGARGESSVVIIVPGVPGVPGIARVTFTFEKNLLNREDDD